ncbi:prelamin-A/C-like [Saccoglossus kowalevskii]|uniref:Prelamin-A/C-like n=1 Tax=Saccoglossus kowalevskii TaxID=10224 RepID=A0ABM0GS62_SACKO|nr:PREDICTED: prelamin-A/C-like [Saccoglossus kowalevskii]
MSAYISSSSSVPMTRHQEKTELSLLNDRYSDYIAKVRKLQQEANQDDSSALLNSIRNLEEEINSIKALYDNELDKLRRELEGVTSEKQRLELFAKKNNGLATELQDRLSVEQRQNQALIGELGNLQQLLGKKDLEINQLAGERDDLAKKFNDLQRDYDGLLRDFEEVSRKLEKETLAKNEALNALDNLQKKLDFHMQVNAEEAAEMKSRLEDKAKQILMLEGKVRELGRSDNTLHELLARVRDTAHAELQKYKEESEAQYAKNLHELQIQMEQDAENIARLADENKKLCEEIDNYRREIHTLQNKVRTLEHNNGDLSESLDQERQKSSVHIQSLEAKLKEIQDMLIYKLQELGSGKEPPIRAEIESLKVLVEEEENRLHNIERAHTAVPPINTSGITTSLTGHNKLPLSYTPGSRLVKCGVSYSGQTRSSPPAYAGKFANTTGMSTSVTSRGYTRPTRPASVPAPVTGQGKDYFDSMFGDVKRDTLYYPRLHPKSSPPSFTPATHDYNTSTSSFTGTIKILEINQDGRFVRLFNSSPNQDMEFGGFMIQQNVGGHPVAVYRFPPRTRFRAGSTITVWAASGQGKHSPPTDFLWKEQHKWGVGPECTTILCKPTGQAIAWTTAAHRFTRNAISFDAVSDNSSDADKGESNPSPEFTVEVDGKPVTALKVEKEEQPLLSPAKHPHGLFTGDDPHPSMGAPRVKAGGNDNSSYCRQTRSQNSNPVPDRMPHPGDLYAGAGAGGTRLGSAPLRSSSAMKANNGSKSTQLSPFMSPHQQKYSTVNKISSQHRVTFQPPMPRPPVVSSW